MNGVNIAVTCKNIYVELLHFLFFYFAVFVVLVFVKDDADKVNSCTKPKCNDTEFFNYVVQACWKLLYRILNVAFSCVVGYRFLTCGILPQLHHNFLYRVSAPLYFYLTGGEC